MNEISINRLTMSSREIAELTGKQHAHVLRDIRAMLEELKKDDPNLDDPYEDKDARGYTTCIYLTRELTDCLLTGYSAVARMRVIKRWHELEEKQKEQSQIVDAYRYYHSRVSLTNNKAPNGYYLIFSECSPLFLDMIAAGMSINPHVVPDISVGIVWGKHWADECFSSKYGNRIEHLFSYPSDFPQSLSNPHQVHAYPNASLGEFRNWFTGVYLPEKYPTYIKSKSKLLAGGRDEAIRIGSMYQTQPLIASK